MPLGERASCGESRYLGVSVRPGHGQLAHVLQESLRGGFDFVLVPLQDGKADRWHPDDASIECDTWRTRVVAQSRPWMDEEKETEESMDACAREEETHLKEELERHMQVWMCVDLASPKDRHGSEAWGKWHQDTRHCKKGTPTSCS
eukprot:jgi/Pico_ML_1/52804/g3458.t1